jgi:EAL domain-containing protein (putative c-di-GMP-specific phosphodiesterase class I)/ActR/RegA family two-component response regulator
LTVLVGDIQVLVADDEKVVRDALADLIEASDGMAVAAVAADADEAIAAARRELPDVALVDVRMPGGGAKATRGIRAASRNTRVLALSASGSGDTVLEMLRAGAAGYLVKGILPSAVIDGIRHVALGETPLSAEVAGGVVDRLRLNLASEDRERRRRQELLKQLTVALDGGGLQIAYQPIFDLERPRLVGVEALSRFSLKPARPPNEWFAAAAEIDLAIRLEVTAVKKAIAQRSQLPPGVFMAVNLSPEALVSPDVQGVIPNDFADRLVVELTEHSPVLDYPALAVAFSPLRAAGASLAIDDAGAGFASLRHLLELAPQYIKLDISITQKLEHDRTAYALAVALTSFAAAIDAMIIAEGIETESQYNALRALGVRLGQGYYLAKPGSLAEALLLTQPGYAGEPPPGR